MRYLLSKPPVVLVTIASAVATAGCGETMTSPLASTTVTTGVLQAPSPAQPPIDTRRIFAESAALATAPAAAPIVQVRTETTPRSTSHPVAAVSAGGRGGSLHVLSGGALANWRGSGSMLFNTSFEISGGQSQWVAESKDHIVGDPATVTAFALLLQDPQNLYVVQPFFSRPSAPASAPQASSTLPPGWVLVGGGCSIDWGQGRPGVWGNMLTASHPVARPDGTADTWECGGSDLKEASPATVTAVAIGIRPNPAAARPPRMPVMCVSSVVSRIAAHPSAVAQNCGEKRGGQITGGGARSWSRELAYRDLPPGRVKHTAALNRAPPAGQFLVGTAPVVTQGVVTGWEARSKDHLVSSPGTVTAYAISVTF